MPTSNMSHQWMKRLIEETREKIENLEEKVQKQESAARTPLVLLRRMDEEN